VDAATGEPIIGASIHVKGNKRIGAVSDMQGGYTLSAAPGVTLVISYIGYETLEVRATEKEQVIQLTENSKTLSELVVVGYTTQRKESLTDDITTLLGSLTSSLGSIPRSAPLGDSRADGDAVGDRAHAQSLRISITQEEGNPFHGAHDTHLIDGIASASSDTHHLDELRRTSLTKSEIQSPWGHCLMLHSLPCS